MTMSGPTSFFQVGHRAMSAQLVRMNTAASHLANAGSIAGREGLPTFGAYAVTKAGMILFTQVLAVELATHKINVNCVCPGLIGTHRMTDVTSPGPIRDAVMPTIPLGREGAPEEVAAVVAFLAGPGGSYIHGQTINVDGGRLMR